MNTTTWNICSIVRVKEGTPSVITIKPTEMVIGKPTMSMLICGATRTSKPIARYTSNRARLMGQPIIRASLNISFPPERTST